ncbi:unnamed protein product [Amoebophrya sp. A120]|nr:unnamed protein product [Amoebophrya sp. A120]|eukprot:GSA120T00020312001.1
MRSYFVIFVARPRAAAWHVNHDHALVVRFSHSYLIMVRDGKANIFNFSDRLCLHGYPKIHPAASLSQMKSMRRHIVPDEVEEALGWMHQEHELPRFYHFCLRPQKHSVILPGSTNLPLPLHSARSSW